LSFVRTSVRSAVFVAKAGLGAVAGDRLGGAEVAAATVCVAVPLEVWDRRLVAPGGKGLGG
jgi:hypothetical protein